MFDVFSILGVSSPEKQRTRTTSTTSSNSSSPPLKLSKRSFYSTFDEEEEENINTNNSSVSIYMNKLDLKSTGTVKKSYSRLPQLSKRPRLSLESNMDRSDHFIQHDEDVTDDNLTPLTSLQMTAKRNVR